MVHKSNVQEPNVFGFPTLTVKYMFKTGNIQNQDAILPPRLPEKCQKSELKVALTQPRAMDYCLYHNKLFLMLKNGLA